MRQLGLRPGEAEQAINDALERPPGMETPEALFEEIYRARRGPAHGGDRRRLRAAEPDSPLADEAQFERTLRPRRLDEYIGQQEAVESLRRLRGGGAPAGRVPRPRAALRSAGPREDHAGLHPRQRDGERGQDHLGPGPRARRRPDGDPDQPGAGGRALHRRDPPPAARGGGAALPGDGGLRGQLRRREGDARAHHAHPAQAVHAGRARRRARACSARPSGSASASSITSTSTTTRSWPGSWAARPASWAWPSRRRGRSRSPGARAARPASPTGCSAACATSPR